jgi:hypothetical protein
MIFKKKVNLWVFDPYNDRYLLSGFFKIHFSDYFNIKVKKFGKHKLNPKQHNLTILPCTNFNILIKTLENFPQKIYDICCKNNIKFAISYIRETITPDDMKKFENCFEKYFLNKDYSNLKIFLNGYENIQYSKYKNLFVFFDVFDHLLRTYLNKKIIYNFNVLKKRHLFKKNKKYNFSLFAGLLVGRKHRQLFLFDCFKQNLLNDDFFYNIVYFNRNTVIQQIYQYVFKTNERYDFSITDKRKFIKDIFKEKLYDFNGKEFDKNSLYSEHLEYQIPYQMMDSYINIVLETNIYCPVITEKIFKPIIAGVPFIWYGYHGILKYLESKGYKKYPFIDYTFDLIEDPIERRYSVITEIKRLKTLDLQKEVFLYKKIAKHNRKMFYKNTKKFERFEEYLNGQF